MVKPKNEGIYDPIYWIDISKHKKSSYFDIKFSYRLPKSFLFSMSRWIFNKTHSLNHTIQFANFKGPRLDSHEFVSNLIVIVVDYF